MEQNSEIIIYTAPDGTTKLQVQLEDETVWLTQEQMAMLFGKAKSTINEHIKNIYAEELEKSQTLKKFGISEFQQKAPNYYNLDVIISVGYRVKSPIGRGNDYWQNLGQIGIAHTTEEAVQKYGEILHDGHTVKFGDYSIEQKLIEQHR